MAIDPRIPLGGGGGGGGYAAPRPMDPFEMMVKLETLRGAQEERASREEARVQAIKASQTLEEQRRAQMADAALKRKHLEDTAAAWKNAYDPATGKVDRTKLFQNVPGTALPEVMKQVDEAEKAAVELQDSQTAFDKKKKQMVGALARTVEQAKNDPHTFGVVLHAAKGMGLISEDEFNQGMQLTTPEQIAPVIQDYITKSRVEEPKLEQVEVYDPATQTTVKRFVEPKVGAEYQQTPKKPENLTEFEKYLDTYATEKKKTAKQLTTAEIEDARKRYFQADDKPTPPRELHYAWATPKGATEAQYMTAEEIRQTGATQPPTAEMRSQQTMGKMVSRSVDAIKAYADKLITKVGPAQRAEALKRGASAVLGSDPEFRTYDSARMALAGNLALRQQGRRLSDADVRLMWLPMVPDVFSDTAESAKMKWDLIGIMSDLPIGEGKTETGRPNVPASKPTVAGFKVVR